MDAAQGLQAPKAATLSNMVFVDGGEFLMGSDSHYPEEKPARRVRVDGFWMDRTPITNREFARFVEATGYTLQRSRPTPRITPASCRRC